MVHESLKKPLARKDVTVQEIGDEVMLYDSAAEKIHVLNHSAFEIWKLCDGSNTEEDIFGLFSGLYPDAGDDVFNDIKLVIADFKEKGLLD